MELTTMKLFHFPWSRSTRAQWMLEELGVSYELIHVDLFSGEGNAEEHLGRHPHGCVPVLVDGNISIFESGAICAYLADKYPDKRFAPRPGDPQRAYYFQWMFYTSATLECVATDLFVQRKLRDENERSLSKIAEAKETFHDTARYLEKVLVDRRYLLGDDFSAADIMLGCTFMWNEDQLIEYPVITHWLNRLRERAAFLKVANTNMTWDTGKTVRSIQLAPSQL